MSFLGLAHFGLAPQKRSDVVNEDLARVSSNANGDEPVLEPLDASADVKTADGIKAGNGFAYGAPTITPGDIHK